MIVQERNVNFYRTLVENTREMLRKPTSSTYHHNVRNLSDERIKQREAFGAVTNEATTPTWTCSTLLSTTRETDKGTPTRPLKRIRRQTKRPRREGRGLPVSSSARHASAVAGTQTPAHKGFREPQYLEYLDTDAGATWEFSYNKASHVS